MKNTKLFVPALIGGLFVFALAAPASADVSYNLSGWDTSQTRTAGHLEITSDGLHVWTDDASSQAKVAAYRSPAEGTNLDNIGTPAIDWDGTSPAPGLQLVIDVPGGTGQDGILVGESVYGDKWWLSNGSIQELKDKAPHTGGGNGSNWFGTLAEWNTALEDAQGNPQGWISKVGFSLGSGVKGDGVIKSLTFRGEKYTFQEPTEVTPEEPTYTPPTCFKRGVVTVKVTEGVTYTFTTPDISPTATVKATAKVGYVLAKGSVTEWSYPIARLRGDQCSTGGPSSPTPTATATATATPTTSATPTPTSTPTPGAPVQTTAAPSTTAVASALPVTGAKVSVVALGAIALVAAGALLVVAARRKRNSFEA